MERLQIYWGSTYERNRRKKKKKGFTVEVGYKGVSSGKATARNDPKQLESVGTDESCLKKSISIENTIT